MENRHPPTPAVILAGGQGSRLWPISRDRAPKQFQPVVRDRPLLTGTIERLSELVDPARIHVSTRARFADAACANLGPVPAENLILEEDPAGPATAFALSIATLAHKYGNAPAHTLLERVSAPYVVDGRELCAALRREHATVPIIWVSGIDRTREIASVGATRFLPYDAWLTIGNEVDELLGASPPAPLA